MPKKEKKTNLSSDQKQKLRHAKMRMHDQITEKKVETKLKNKINKGNIAHPELMNLSVYKNGIQNKFHIIEPKFNDFMSKYKENKGEKSDKLKKEYTDIKAFYKKEHDLLHTEVKQINKLNSKGKGELKIKNAEENIIEVKNLNKFYTTKEIIFKALNQVNLEIKRGEFVVILGPSGSGKTTLLNSISGLDRSTTGEVVINDINIQALTTRELTQFRRSNIGFVFQSYNLLPTLNASDNVEIGRSLQTDPNKRKSIKKMFEQMDMGQNINKRTYELSGGQQQRISIARALAKTPDILIGDEPTGALDQTTSKKVFELFQNICKENKTTVIVVTHNPNIALIANKVIKVKNGKIDSIKINNNPKKASDLKEI